MQSNYLPQLISLGEKFVDEINLSEQRWVEQLLRMATATDPKEKAIWEQTLQKGQQETVEAGKVYYYILNNQTMRYEALKNTRKGERERYFTYQNLDKGEIWCYISKTKFVLGPITRADNYIERLKAYVDQMKVHNKNLKEERKGKFAQATQANPNGVPVKEILPESSADGDEIITDDHMSRWEVQIDWWEFIYTTELLKHGEGFTRAALELGDLISVVSGMYYFQLFGASNIVSQLQNKINQLEADKSPEAQVYLKEVVALMMNFQKQSPGNSNIDPLKTFNKYIEG